MAVTLITEQELIKLAVLSCIKLEEHELAPLCESLDAVLGYASRLKTIAAQYPDVQEDAPLTTIFRADHAQLCTEPLVDSAAVHENNYFVVPMIIKQS